MLIIRKSRNIKSRYVGFISDIYNDHLDTMTTKPRVFSDEIPLPDYDFCIRRSTIVMTYDSSTAWVKLGLKIFEKLINGKLV